MTRPAWHKEKGTDQRKLVGRPWRRLRDAVLLRDKYTCQGCKRVFLPSELHCDHIVPVAKQGNDDMSNLQSLCASFEGHVGCHEKKTIKETGGKVKRAYGADGWPL